MKKHSYIFLLVCLPFFCASQNGGLLDILGEEETTDYAEHAFKSPRVINSHSMEMLPEGVLDFRILHRFGDISGGAYEMFGLDNATMRMGFDYGISQNLTLGIGRSTHLKEFDGFVKYRFLRQRTGKAGRPVSVIWTSGITYTSLKNPFQGEEVNPSRRTAYYHQLIVGRKFSEAFTLQAAPFLVYRNYTANSLDPNALYGLEIGLRQKVTKRMAILADYSLAFNRFPGVVGNNPLSIGVDIETGGHVFQLHFSNAVGMNERSFISDQNRSWLDGDFQFGFNLSRVFQVKKQALE